nr:hypothetical protein [Streptomyces sp. AA1529]
MSASGAPAVPRMRAPFSSSPEGATPIYDSLYAEYRRLFRALPGDRSGEEELRFEGFGTAHGIGSGSWSGQESPAAWHTPAWQLPALPPAPRHGPHR